VILEMEEVKGRVVASKNNPTYFGTLDKGSNGRYYKRQFSYVCPVCFLKRSEVQGFICGVCLKAENKVVEVKGVNDGGGLL
jgi:hypothetical protein